MTERPFGCILAGGRASRMGGGDKGLLKIGGRTILERIIERLSPQLSALVLNVNGDPTRFAGLGLPVLPDEIEEASGPLAGLLAALAHARKAGADRLLTVPGDTPFLPRDLAARLASALVGCEIAIAASGGRQHPVIGLWPVGIAEDLRSALMQGLRKVEAWTARYRTGIAEWAADSYDPFFNVNRPEDVNEAERIAAEFGL